jgi:hypothetical protein
MALNPDALTDTVRDVLQRYTAHVLPLTRAGKCNRDDAAGIQGVSPALLFPGARPGSRSQRSLAPCRMLG